MAFYIIRGDKEDLFMQDSLDNHFIRYHLGADILHLAHDLPDFNGRPLQFDDGLFQELFLAFANHLFDLEQGSVAGADTFLYLLGYLDKDLDDHFLLQFHRGDEFKKDLLDYRMDLYIHARFRP